MTFHDTALVQGSKGSSGGKGGSSGSQGAVESPNTLRSNAKARIVEILGEGEIEGIVNGAQGVFFDTTPLQNAGDLTFNFQGVGVDSRNGQPDQAVMPSFPIQETPVTVETRVQAKLGPVVRTIDDPNADVVKVVMRVPALARQDTTNGNTYGADVSYAIEIRQSGGSWLRMAEETIAGKNTSPYQRATVVRLPQPGNPWDIRVIRLTPDSDKVALQNDTYWESFVIINEARLTYPDTAVVGLTVDAQQFGNSIPARSYHVRGLRIQVPTNYDPVGRTYSGIWDGTFKKAWTNNPAWILYDLLTNNRYGLGEFINADTVDKWSLYQIGRYCDEPVSTGIRRYDGLFDLEPRFVFNGVINTRDEAYKVLQNITGAFRGMAYWSLGQVFASADIPQDPVADGGLITPSNVIGGRFTYSGTAMKARHSVAMVSWNDPADFYRTAIELVQDDEAIQRFGWRETEVQAHGCTSRGQAHRYGKWIIDSEQNETEMVEFSVSWAQSKLKPGDIVLIADPRKTGGIRTGGRIAEVVSGQRFKLDAPFVPSPSTPSYTLYAVLPDLTVEARQIASFAQAEGDGFLEVVTVSPFSATPIVNANWVISGQDVNPRRFRIMAISESEPNVFKVQALFNDPTKYARVEEGIALDPVSYRRPKDRIKPVTNVRAEESLFFQNGAAASKIMASWTPPDDFMAAFYLVSADTPHGFISYPRVQQPSIDIEPAATGDWTLYVSAQSFTGLTSVPVSYKLTVAGWESAEAPFVSHLEILGRGNETTFGGTDCTVIWRNNFPDAGTHELGSESYGGQGATNPFYRDNVVRIFDAATNDLLRTEITTGERYTYTFAHNREDNALLSRGPSRKFRVSVTVRDNLGRESAPVAIVPENPVPALIIPNVAPGYELLSVAYTLPQDLDVRGALVWVSDDENFDPITTTPAYDGPNNFVSFPAEPLKVHYVRVGAYDAFGREGMNISPPIKATTGGFILDTNPPAVPAGLVLTPELTLAADGTIQSVLTAQWDDNPSENYASDEIQIRAQGDANWIMFPARGTYRWTGLAYNTTYEVQLRSVSQSDFRSAWTDIATVLIPANENAPGAPTGLTALSSLKSVYLSWVNPTDTDLDHIEVWESTTNNRASATLVGSSKGIAFTRAGVTTGTPLFYWVRAVNTSGNAGGFNALAGFTVTPGEVQNGDLAANVVTADKVMAEAIEGRHIKVDTEFPASIKVGDTGVTIGDPAGLINLPGNTTLVDPGKILISGDVMLSSWRDGSDLTKIAGGSIQANTIDANKLTIGSRGLTFAGLQFNYVAETNTVSWTGGTVSYMGDAGLMVTDAVTPGSQVWTAGTIYIAFRRGQLALVADTAPIGGINDVLLATYRGGSDLVANYGRTQIEGSTITTRTISAEQLVAQTITANELASDSIKARHITAGEVTADKLGAGTISASQAIKLGGDRFTLNAASQDLEVTDETGRLRVKLGKLGALPTDYGIQLWDKDGNQILGAGGQIPNIAIQAVDLTKITGAGGLAGKNSVNLTNGDGISGTISAANISTYIANAAIQNAQIADLAVTSAKIANLAVTDAQIANLTVGTIKIVDGSISSTAGTSAVINGNSIGVGMNLKGGPLMIQATVNKSDNSGVYNAVIASAPNTRGYNIRWGNTGQVLMQLVATDVVVGFFSQQTTNHDIYNFYFLPGSCSGGFKFQPGAGYHEFYLDNPNGYNVQATLTVTELAK